MELKALNEALVSYINPQTPSLAVKMVEKGGELPEKVKLPSKHFKHRLTICQAFNMARFNGLAIALGKEDQSCPVGSVILGFQKPVPYYTEGKMVAGMYAADLEVGAKMEEDLQCFPHGKYSYLLIAPLARAAFDPDFIYIYCNPAQLMRLVQGARYNSGMEIKSSFSGRAECAHAIVPTIETGDYQVVLPSNGERVFAHTQDHEMSFTVPIARAEDLVSGLEGSHKNGIRYPIPFFINYKATFPPNISKVEEIWSEEK